MKSERWIWDQTLQRIEGHGRELKAMAELVFHSFKVRLKVTLES